MDRYIVALQTAQEFRLKKWPYAISNEMLSFMQFCESMSEPKTAPAPVAPAQEPKAPRKGWRPRTSGKTHCQLCDKEISSSNKCGVCSACQHPNRRKCKDCWTVLAKSERPIEYEKKQCGYCMDDELRRKSK